MMRQSDRYDCVTVVGMVVVLRGRRRAESRELRKEGAALALAGRAVETPPVFHVTSVVRVNKGHLKTAVLHHELHHVDIS